MKILMIAPQPFYTERGTPMNVKLMCRVLGDAGHSIDLIVFPTGREIKLKNVRIIYLPNVFKAKSISIGPSLLKMAFDILLASFCLLLCLTKRYDVIHGIEEGGFLAVGLAGLFGMQSIFDMDSSISDQLKYSRFIKNPVLIRAIVRMEKLALRRSSMIITVCAALSEKAILFAPKGCIVQIEDIPLPDIEKGDRYLEKAEALIDEYDLEGKKRVVYTGNLQAYQGISLLLAAWKVFQSAKENGQNAVLVIVGGPDELVSHYKRKCETEGIKNCVYWIGSRPAEEMGGWMQLGHVLVSPRSEGDNTPLKIYTYMTSGRAIVATKRMTHTQVLDDSTAFLTEADPVQFAEAILEALSNPSLSNEKAEKAKRIVETKYSYKVFREKLLDAYGSL